MIRGGYQIIDFTGITAFDGSQSLPGAFDKIKAAKKPILAYNFVGCYLMTCDVAPTNSLKAIMTGVIESSGSLVPIGIVINADDTVEMLS